MKKMSEAQEIKASRKSGTRCVAVPVCGGYALIRSSAAIKNSTKLTY